MIGVSFQPGDYGQPNGEGRPTNGSGVQEAIRILSLRLPRVAGAQGAVAPMPLLTSPGSGGDPRIDRIVDQVMARVLPPQTGSPAPVLSGPSMGSGPSFTGSAPPAYERPLPPAWRPTWTPPPNFRPRVVVDNQSWGDTAIGPDGRPLGSGPGLIAPLPNLPTPPASRPPSPPVPTFGSGGGSQFDDPLMF